MLRRTCIPITLVSAAVLLLGACSPLAVIAPPPGDDGDMATLFVSADVSTVPVATVVVVVTAPDISTPLAFNIPIVSGVATGTVTVPAGSDRTFTLNALDASGIKTHSGSVTRDIVAGSNGTITIVLDPLTGDQPIDVTLGSVTVSVTPTVATLIVGETQTLTASILDSNGNPVVATVEWATLNPAVATVLSTGASTGLVTAEGVGTIDIIATYAGTGVASTITVN